MNIKQWNTTMLTSMLLIVLVSLPFFAMAFSFDFFDDNFQPFDDIFGNLPGPDVIVPEQDPDDDDNDPGDFPITIPDPDPDPDDDPTDGGTGFNPSSNERFSIFIHQIFVNDMIVQESGNLLPMHLAFESDGTKSLDNTKVIVMIPELGARASVGPLDLQRGKKTSRTVLLEVPSEVEPGIYHVRVHMHTLGTSRVVHREVEIV